MQRTYTKEELFGRFNDLFNHKNKTFEQVIELVSILELMSTQYQFLDPKIFFTVYDEVAMRYFNNKQYQAAINYYQKAINVKMQNAGYLSDDDHRAVALEYIDLMDAYFALYNTQAAIYAFHKAVITHKRIKSPRADELEFMEHSFNAAKFRLHYEKKSSNESFINSHDYAHQNYIILQAYQEYFMDCIADDLMECGLNQVSDFCSLIAQKQMKSEHYIQLAQYYIQITETYVSKIHTLMHGAYPSDYILKAQSSLLHAYKTYSLLPSNSSHSPEAIQLQSRLHQLQQQLQSQPSLQTNQTTFSDTHTNQQSSAMDLDNTTQQSNSNYGYGQIWH